MSCWPCLGGGLDRTAAANTKKVKWMSKPALVELLQLPEGCKETSMDKAWAERLRLVLELGATDSAELFDLAQRPPENLQTRYLRHHLLYFFTDYPHLDPEGHFTSIRQTSDNAMSDYQLAKIIQLPAGQTPADFKMGDNWEKKLKLLLEIGATNSKQLYRILYHPPPKVGSIGRYYHFRLQKFFEENPSYDKFKSRKS